MMNIYAFADEASPSVDGQIKAMLRNRLQGVEMRGVDGQNVADLSEEKAKEVLAKLKAKGLKVWSIGSPIGKINIETDDWQAHLDRFRNALKVANALECGNMRMFSFYIPEGHKAEEYRDEIISRLKTMVEIAVPYGVRLCHENEKGIYGDIAPRCLDLLENVPGLGCVFDPANFIQCGQDIPEAWEMLKDRVDYMHIKDCLANGRVVPSGEGLGHLEEILADFEKNGGNNVSVEPHLQVFEGFGALENGQKTEIPEGMYATSDEAFDTACRALRKYTGFVRLGIIGVGNIGTGHVQNFLAGRCPEVRITCAADRRESRREWFKKNVPGVPVFNEGEDLIASGLCDAVMVCVPHYQHPGLAISAMKHGLHTMVEKPAGVYTLQVSEMNAEAEKHPELTFGMMFNQRTNCVYRKMKEMLDNGELGEIKRMSWLITDWYRTQSYYDSGAWRATWAGEGGGVLLNQCPHQLDLLQWLFGLPVKVRAFCHEGKWHDIEVEDDVTAYLEFENGATGIFVTTTGDAPGTNRLEVTGTKGKLVCENDTLVFSKLKTDEREWCRTCPEGFKKPEWETFNVETDGENPQHPGVMNAFCGHILRGEELIANGAEGIRGLTLSNAMHLSAWTDSEVTVPFDEQLFLKLLNERRATSRHKDAADVTFTTEGTY